MRKHFFLLTIAALVLFGCGENKQNQPAADMDAEEVETSTLSEIQPVANLLPFYVIPDENGVNFLLQEDFEDNIVPEVPDSLYQYKYIICDNNYYPIRFKGAQLGNPEEDTYRDVSSNFDNMPGWVFEMQEGRLIDLPGKDNYGLGCVLLVVDENYKNTTTLFELKDNRYDQNLAPTVSDDLKATFKQRYGREIHCIWAEAGFGDNDEYQLVNVWFENQGTSALGVTAFIENDEIKAVKEFPAEYDEWSTWRVDDEGEFYGLGINQIAMEDGVMKFYLYDSGAEGCIYKDYVIKDGMLCEGNIYKSIYWAPM